MDPSEHRARLAEPPAGDCRRDVVAVADGDGLFRFALILANEVERAPAYACDHGNVAHRPVAEHDEVTWLRRASSIRYGREPGDVLRLAEHLLGIDKPPSAG